MRITIERGTFTEIKQNFGFVIRYGMLSSNEIYNVRKFERKKDHDQKIAFHIKLEQSVLKDGFINPILVYAGSVYGKYKNRIPKEMQNNPKQLIACIDYGCSRLAIAQMHNLFIPCIILDYLNIFPNLKQVMNEKELCEDYQEQPAHVKIGINGLMVVGLPNIHMVD